MKKTRQEKLIEAVREGDLKKIKEQLKKGADINGTLCVEDPPLVIAALCKQEAAARYLLEKGAKIDKKDGDGWTALMTAAETSGATEIVRLLLDHGASVDKTSQHGSTALIVAVRGKSIDTLDLLIEKGAAVDAQNLYGETALIAAAKQGWTEGVKRLLEAGANPGIKNRAGWTAQQVAYKREYHGIVEIIVQSTQSRSAGFEAEIRKSKRDIFNAKQAYLKKHAPRLILKRGPGL
jgi:ankyrin repeat protein